MHVAIMLRLAEYSVLPDFEVLRAALVIERYLDTLREILRRREVTRLCTRKKKLSCARDRS